jgi:hypothetical protein
MFSALVNWWKERQRARRAAVMFEREVVVVPDEQGVTVTAPSGESQRIEWSAVDCIAIETNDSGPWDADVWWVLEGAGMRIAYPQGATGDEAMLEGFPERFPDFSHEAVIRAMGCAENARFVCWQRPGAG